MGQYFLLRPAVYGQLGRNAILDRKTLPGKVKKLHLILDAPPHDDLHKVANCFLLSARLADHIVAAGLTGGSLAGLTVELDEQYLDFHPGTPIPEVRWLTIQGRAQEADFGLDDQGRLVVSEVALAALRLFRLEACMIYDFGNLPNPGTDDGRSLGRSQTSGGRVKTRSEHHVSQACCSIQAVFFVLPTG